MSRVRRALKWLYRDALGIQRSKQAAAAILHAEFRALREAEARRMPSNIALKGYKVYSQNEEDGIRAAIFDAIGGGSTFLEIGVEDGRECNTHLLLLKGWRGIWIEGAARQVRVIGQALGALSFPGQFEVRQSLVFPHNMAEHYRSACAFLEVADLDLFSLDVDGNDLFILQALLASGARPKVICIEYNGKFPPDMAISIAERTEGGWNADDHFGASLAAFDPVLRAGGYQLVTCNLTGANAFYVLASEACDLRDHDVADVWQPMRLDLMPMPSGHKPSLRYLRERLQQAARP